MIWHYDDIEVPFPYGDEHTYRSGIAYVDQGGTLEDWGCGTTYARNFVRHSTYFGIDGAPSRFVDKVADLRSYTSDVDAIFMRHVLEHNYDWPGILANALSSFRRRMAVVIFTPFSPKQTVLHERSGIPDISLCEAEFEAAFGDVRFYKQDFDTMSEYTVERVYFLDREPDPLGTDTETARSVYAPAETVRSSGAIRAGSSPRT